MTDSTASAPWPIDPPTVIAGDVRAVLEQLQSDVSKCLARAGDKYENDEHLTLEGVETHLVSLVELLGGTAVEFVNSEEG